MPRFNFYFILFAVLAYVLTARITLRDRLLISTLHQIEHSAYFEPSAKKLFEGAMFGMAESLSVEFGDGYSMYIPQNRQTLYQDRLENRYEGFGMSIRLHENEKENQFFLDYPQYDSPAYRVGLRSGDQILQVANTPLADKTYREMTRILSKQELETRFSVLPFGQTKPQDFFMRQEKIHSDSIEGDYFDTDKRVFWLEAHPNIGYVRITSFSGTTAKEFGDALDCVRQSGAEAFILDLRNNPGGDLWTCIQIAQMLISPSSDWGNVIVTIQDRYDMARFRHRNFVLVKELQRCTLPMVVLIDGESASASEILAAALQDHHRATIVGSRSFGKGIIQSIIVLPFQSGILQLTDSEYRRPNGAGIHRKQNATDSDDWGVIPDKIVDLSDEEQEAVVFYRELRSNVISAERSVVLERFRQQIIETVFDECAEFTGVAPYYDPQLDAAIKILQENTK